MCWGDSLFSVYNRRHVFFAGVSYSSNIGFSQLTKEEELVGSKRDQQRSVLRKPLSQVLPSFTSDGTLYPASHFLRVICTFLDRIFFFQPGVQYLQSILVCVDIHCSVISVNIVHSCSHHSHTQCLHCSQKCSCEICTACTPQCVRCIHSVND